MSANDVGAFLEHVETRLSMCSGRLIMRATSYLEEHACCGFWDDTRRELYVAVARPDWLAILAHEVGHVEQFLANRWIDSTPHGNVDEWLSKKIELSPRRLLSSVRAVQRCERDAEMHGIALMRRFNLGNLGDYARHANVYVWSYEIARRTRLWPNRKAIVGAERLAPARLLSERDLGRVPSALESVLASAAIVR